MSTRVDRILQYIGETRYESLSPAAVSAARVFVLDSIGVGISGSRVPFASALAAMAGRQWGGAGGDGGPVPVRVWNTAIMLPAASAAMVNAYQIHNQEYDCVHERAVVHPMAVILASLQAFAEQGAAAGNPVDGRRFIAALNVAVDVATILGMSATRPMQFFRPGVCGGLGAVAGICNLAGLGPQTGRNALGIMYSQLCGTMQAHLEGSATLPMQIAFNARNALMAVDMALAGLEGPGDFLDGQFGLFSLMQDGGNADAAFALLGREPQLPQVSHKPFPTGRAAHGTLDGLATLQRQQGFSAADVEQVKIFAPPLIRRLVDRPASEAMNHNYAKLCIGYIAATFLLEGTVDVTDYTPERIADPRRQALAQRIQMLPNEIDDPNALAPQRVEITLQNGDRHVLDLPDVLGHPGRPLSRQAQLEKFRRCCVTGQQPLAAERVTELLGTIDNLEELADMRILSALTAPRP